MLENKDYWIVGMILVGCGNSFAIRIIGVILFIIWFISKNNKQDA